MFFLSFSVFQISLMCLYYFFNITSIMNKINLIKSYQQGMCRVWLGPGGGSQGPIILGCL